MDLIPLATTLGKFRNTVQLIPYEGDRLSFKLTVSETRRLFPEESTKQEN